jgi:hypothetical protein
MPSRVKLQSACYVRNQNDSIAHSGTVMIDAGACEDLAAKATAKLANRSFNSGIPGST